MHSAVDVNPVGGSGHVGDGEPEHVEIGWLLPGDDVVSLGKPPSGPVGILITWTLAVSVSWLTGDGSKLTAGPDEQRKNRKASGDAPKEEGPTVPERRG